MDSTSSASLAFEKPLFLDRKRGKYTFEDGSDCVQVVSTGGEIDLESLELLFNPFSTVHLASPWDMFEEEVLDSLRDQDLEHVPPPRRAQPVAPAAPVQPVAPKPPRLSVRERHQAARRARESVTDWLAGDRAAALARGEHDGEIREVFVDACQRMAPQATMELVGLPEGEAAPTCGDHAANTALGSQGFGTNLDLDDEGLGQVAKSAILQGLADTAFENVLMLKQKILRGQGNPRYASMVKQYYRSLHAHFERNDVPREIAELVETSKCIYLDEPARELDRAALILGTADAFAALRESNRRALDVASLIPERLRRVLPPEMGGSVERTESFLKSVCFREHPDPALVLPPEGHHAHFGPIGPSLSGALVFQVRGHDEEPGWMRDLLVYVVERMQDRRDPTQVVGVLNRFALQYPFPAEVSVDLLYGVVDPTESTFTYSTAGAHGPMLIRKGAMTWLNRTDETPLNKAHEAFRGLRCRLEIGDSLVFVDSATADAITSDVTADEDVAAGEATSAQTVGRLTRSIVEFASGDSLECDENLRFQVYKHL